MEYVRKKLSELKPYENNPRIMEMARWLPQLLATLRC